MPKVGCDHCEKINVYLRKNMMKKCYYFYNKEVLLTCYIVFHWPTFIASFLKHEIYPKFSET